MTLKEKYLDIVKIPFKDKVYLDVMDKAEQCEAIANDYAIGFGEWCLKIKFEPIENISVKKLLEIYKKENGL